MRSLYILLIIVIIIYMCKEDQYSQSIEPIKIVKPIKPIKPIIIFDEDISGDIFDLGDASSILMGKKMTPSMVRVSDRTDTEGSQSSVIF